MISIEYPTDGDLRTKRDAILASLGMTLEQARGQWRECGCCLAGDNWDDLEKLEQVKDCDYLLGESA